MKKLILFFGAIVLFVGLGLGNFKSSSSEYRARVLETDNSSVTVAGIGRIGEQNLKIQVLNGPYKGEKLEIPNLLSGSLEYDEFYKEGDKILAAVVERKGVLRGKALSLYRMDSVAGLGLMFVVFLILYAGKTGVKSIISFLASIGVLWKFFIPALKDGNNIFFITIITLIILSAIIIFLVAGFTKKGIAAFLGTMTGLFVTTLLTFMFGGEFNLDGMNQPFAQGIAFTTNLNVSLLQIFYAAITLGASGAAMDIAMDMAATVEELHINASGMSRKDLVKSGFNVGKMVIGTMTTTLLLAYSGGCLTLLMLFMQRNVSILLILNMKLVTSEIVKILIGSIGLVAVAPITAYISAWIYTSEFEKKSNFLIKLFYSKKKECNLLNCITKLK
ncbi:MAG: YibE/F family protein [Fusobacteriaceae bacterium]